MYRSTGERVHLRLSSSRSLELSYLRIMRMAYRLPLSFPLKLSLVLSLSCLNTVLTRDPRGHVLNMVSTNIRASRSGKPSIDTIYQFGDSIADTGNWMREDRDGLCTTFPYGESYFHYATGRCSDGLIMVDFYAKAFGLEFLHPYLEKDADFRDGVNFAVGGAAAMDLGFYEEMHFNVSGYTNSTLSIQLGWFQEYLESTCPDCKSKLGTSLILMEAIGCDDYGIIFGDGASFQVAYGLVPDIVREITDVVEEMILMGAVNVVVPSAFPMGCMPIFLTMCNSKHPEMYDDLGCRVDYNEVAEYHNTHLQKAIEELQSTYPDANLIYADYYFAIKSLLTKASSLGFEEDAILTTCCGHGNNPYNFNASTKCGTLGVPVCPHPETRVIWDGMHFTQHFYMYLSNWMLEHTILPQLGHVSSS